MAKSNKSKEVAQQNAPAGFVLFVAWFGALFYFAHQAQGFGGYVLAFLKACVWPAYLLYYALLALGVS